MVVQDRILALVAVLFDSDPVADAGIGVQDEIRKEAHHPVTELAPLFRRLPGRLRLIPTRIFGRLSRTVRCSRCVVLFVHRPYHRRSRGLSAS